MNVVPIHCPDDDSGSTGFGFWFVRKKKRFHSNPFLARSHSSSYSLQICATWLVKMRPFWHIFFPPLAVHFDMWELEAWTFSADFGDAQGTPGSQQTRGGGSESVGGRATARYRTGHQCANGPPKKKLELESHSPAEQFFPIRYEIRKWLNTQEEGV